MLSHSTFPDLQTLKQRFPLLDFLRQLHWQSHPIPRSDEFTGLCPLHPDTHPSFYVNSRKNLFFCHGCGRGGDLIRFLQLSRGLSFSQAVAYLQQQISPPAPDLLLQAAADFFRLQLHRHPQAVPYLASRGLHDPALIDELGIGYAPGGNLRHHLMSLGYEFDRLLDTGLINSQGRDAFCRRVIFPCRQQGQIVNFYGRSIGAGFAHRLLPRTKGGLFAWDSLNPSLPVILVEGLFDLASLWQAGFRNTTCAIGTRLTPAQLEQLAQTPQRSIYIVFDQDENQAGQRASRHVAQQLETAGLTGRIVRLPDGHDPNSYFLAGATTADFQACLSEAQLQ